MSVIKFEVCVDSIESCIEAVKGGATRLELCSALFLGGLTPNYGLMCAVKENELLKDIDVMVMIRPRQGDFLYSANEISIMKHDIEMAKKLNFKGVVFGLLLANGSIDIENTSKLVQLSYPLDVTFHRGFDMTKDYKKSFNDLLEIGNGGNDNNSHKISRILTSGLDSSVIEGIDTIRELIKISKGTHITILPGGGINQKNIAKIIKKTNGLSEYHISGRSSNDSKMEFRNNSVFMGGSLRESEYSLSIVDQNKIKDFINKSNV